VCRRLVFSQNKPHNPVKIRLPSLTTRLVFSFSRGGHYNRAASWKDAASLSSANPAGGQRLSNTQLSTEATQVDRLPDRAVCRPPAKPSPSSTVLGELLPVPEGQRRQQSDVRRERRGLRRQAPQRRVRRATTPAAGLGPVRQSGGREKVQPRGGQKVEEGVALERLRLGFQQEVGRHRGLAQLLVQRVVLVPVLLLLGIVVLVVEERPVAVHLAVDDDDDAASAQEKDGQEEARLGAGRKDVLRHLRQEPAVQAERWARRGSSEVGSLLLPFVFSSEEVLMHEYKKVCSVCSVRVVPCGRTGRYAVIYFATMGDVDRAMEETRVNKFFVEKNIEADLYLAGEQLVEDREAKEK